MTGKYTEGGGQSQSRKRTSEEGDMVTVLVISQQPSLIQPDPRLSL